MELNSPRWRLRAMMFGQYLIMGSWIVTLPTFLMASPVQGGLDFPATSAAWIYGTVALAGLIAPLFVGLLADRLFAAEKLMFVFHLVGSVLLTAAGLWCNYQQPRTLAIYQELAAQEWVEGQPLCDWEEAWRQAPEKISVQQQEMIRSAIHQVNESVPVRQVVSETFLPLFILMFAYAFCCLLTLTISNTITFRNLRDPRNSFGSVRLFGTIGWIVAGVELDFFCNPISSFPFFLAAGISVAFSLFCLFLPHTPPVGHGRSLGDALGIPALSMFRDPSFCVFVLCALGMAGVQQFYSVYANRFLRELGAPRPTAVQTIAQVSEVICMLLFPLALTRLGMKWTMTLGIFAWIGRNALFATLSLPLVLCLGLPLHGLSYSFFFLVAGIYIDRKAPSDLRGSAQGIFTFISMGAGTLTGNWISAQIVKAQTTGHTVAWTTVWLIPAIVSSALFLIFLFFFHTSDEDAKLHADPTEA